MQSSCRGEDRVILRYSLVTGAQVERLTRLRPVGLVIKSGCIPDNLKHDLRDLDRVGRGTFVGASGGIAVGIDDMVLVIWSI